VWEVADTLTMFIAAEEKSFSAHKFKILQSISTNFLKKNLEKMYNMIKNAKKPESRASSSAGTNHRRPRFLNIFFIFKHTSLAYS
jgi:hypothetical protein